MPCRHFRFQRSEENKFVVQEPAKNVFNGIHLNLFANSNRFTSREGATNINTYLHINFHNHNIIIIDIEWLSGICPTLSVGGCGFDSTWEIFV